MASLEKNARTATPSRLPLLILIPTLIALVLGGSRIVTSVQGALAYQRVEQLASMGHDVTSLASGLESERDQTLHYIGEGASGRAGMLTHNIVTGAPQNLLLVSQAQNLTNPWAKKVLADAAAIGSGYPQQVQMDAHGLGNLLKLVPQLRRSAATTQLPPTQVDIQYGSMISQLLAIDNNIALNSGDPALNNDVRALNLVSLIAEGASEQRGLLGYAFAQGGVVNPGLLSAVMNAREQETANIAEYDRVATPQQVSQFNSSVSGSLADFASNYELQAIQYGQDGKPLAVSVVTANEWYGSMTTGTIGGIDAVQQRLLAITISRASALRRQAIITASAVGAAVLIVLLLAPLLIAVVRRSMASGGVA